MEIDNSKIGKYYLFDFDRPHGHERVDNSSVKLTDKEAKQKNYAFAINKTNKLYVKPKRKS